MFRINWKKLKLIWLNWCYINSSFVFFNFLFFIVFGLTFYLSGFWVIILVVLEVVYFIWWLWKNVFYQINAFKLVDFVWSSPISLIIGKLGTGKTLLLTYLNELMKLKTDSLYTNYPIQDKKTKVITFRHFDFRDKTKLIPPSNSFIGFDESFLYIDGTSPKDTKIVHSGKIPWILLARHFGNVAVFTAQRDKMIWNNIRELASCMIIPLSLKLPPKKTVLPKFFIMQLGIFQDWDVYEIWKNKSAERVADGKRSRRKSDLGLGIKFFKVLIPMSIAKKYDSCWLEFVRDMKNDKVKNPREVYWNDISNLSDQELLDLFDIDILKQNLGG